LHEMKEEFWWLDQAIRKIETSVAMGELSSLFEDFKV